MGKPLGFAPGSHLPQPVTPGRRVLRGGVLQGRGTLLPAREEVLGGIRYFDLYGRVGLAYDAGREVLQLSAYGDYYRAAE